MRRASDSVRLVVKRRTDAVMRRVVRAETQTLREAEQEAVRLSSGGYSQGELTAMGHPYARRNPIFTAIAYIINAQSGRFRAGWKTKGPAVTGNRVVSQVRNDSPEAQWMVGTKLMIPRPITTAIVARIKDRRRRRLQAAVKGR